MTGALVVDVVRTPVGLRHGGLSGWHPADLAGLVLAALVERAEVDPALVGDVLLGCAAQVGAQGFNVARNAVLAAGFPESVPAATVDRQCASAHSAVTAAAHAVAAGTHELAVAGGVEVASLVPVGATFGLGVGTPFGPRLAARYADAGGLVPQGVSAELIAEQWSLTRAELDQHALTAHERAAAARAEHGTGAEVLAVPGRRRDSETGNVSSTGADVDGDEGPEQPLTADDLAGAKPSFAPDGVITAANSAPVADAAGAVLLASPAAVERHALTARARVLATATAGAPARLALTGAAPATEGVLARAGIDLAAIDVFEVHEPYAAVGLAWLREVGVDPERVNRSGSALALGHPVGATGARMLASLLTELERTDGRLGVMATGAAGGVAEATVIERIA